MISQQQPVFKQGRHIFEWSPYLPIKDYDKILNYNIDSDSSNDSDEIDNVSISSSNSDTGYDINNNVDEDFDNIIVTDNDEMNLEHILDKRSTHLSSDDDVDQDNDDMKVQDYDSIHPPSKILDIDSFSYNDDTY